MGRQARLKAEKKKFGVNKYAGIIGYTDGDNNQKLPSPEIQIVLRMPKEIEPPPEMFNTLMGHTPKGNMIFIIGFCCDAKAPEYETSDIVFHIGFGEHNI